MVDFELNQDFSVQMAQLETTDPVHADTFNSLYKQLINNDNKLNENKIETSEKGYYNGVATLDPTGNVPATQLNNVHDKYTDSEAVAAINTDGDHGSTAPHNYFSGDYLDLANKPSIAYSTAIPADNFTSEEVSNLQSNVLADGSQPWQSVKMPIGAIIMWSGLGTEIPTGWQICDGTNGTPDLRNRFVVGAGDTYTNGDTCLLYTSPSPRD